MRQRSSPLLLVLIALFTTILAGDAAAQAGRVGGIVKDDKGEPIKGATITVDNQSIGSSFTATTDDKGRFSIIGLRAGLWRFIAQAPGFAADGGEMAVRSGSPTPPVAFSLHRTGPAWSGAMAGIAAKDLQAELTAADPGVDPDVLEGVLKPIAFTEQAAAMSGRDPALFARSDQDYRDVAAKGRSYSGVDYMTATHRRMILRGRFVDLFRRVDALVTPTVAVTAFAASIVWLAFATAVWILGH